MRYCRWSTVLPDNHESDLYIYDHVSGYICVNIAGARLAGIENAPRLSPRDGVDVFVKSYMARSEWRKENKDKLVRTPIDLPYAGESRGFESAADCVKFLEELKALGYRMPESVLDVSIYRKQES